MNEHTLLIVGGVAGAVMALSELLRRGDSRLQSRIAEFSQRQEPVSIEDDVTDAAWSQRLHGAEDSGSFSGLLGTHQLRTELQRAGYSGRQATTVFRITQTLLTVFTGLAAGWIAGQCRGTPGETASIALFAAGTMFLLPGVWLRRRKVVRLRLLNRSLPDFLDLLVTCLDAGLSLEAVIQRVTSELGFAHPVLAAEIARVEREVELGAPADRALQNCADRTDCEAIQSVSIVCLQARKYGTRISAALRTHADLLREQREQCAEVAAQKAAVKVLFPTLLCLFPVVFVVLAGPAAIRIAENLTQSNQGTVQSTN